MTEAEAIDELMYHLEYYARPFNNTPESVNNAVKKTQALNMGCRALAKIEKIESIIMDHDCQLESPDGENIINKIRDVLYKEK